MVSVSWKTLLLPKNFPHNQVLYNYIFGHNETHNGLVLDYGSLLNHHESANVKAGHFEGSYNVEFKVRAGFQRANLNALKICVYVYMHAHIHTYTTETRTHKHFQGHKAHRGWSGNFGSV